MESTAKNAEDTKNPQVSRRFIYSIWAMLAILVIAMLLSPFDNTTELIPDHERALNMCFMLGGLAGLLYAGFAIHESGGARPVYRGYLALCIMFAGFLSTFLLCSHLVNLIEGRIDFPQDKTTTGKGLLMVSRAYHTHGKGASWDIQTMPVWSNMNITETDYNFMLAHRSPNDRGTNPDEITSEGYFCANVTMQRSATAVRVLHAGQQKLPEGTIILCPAKSE